MRIVINRRIEAEVICVAFEEDVISFRVFRSLMERLGQNVVFYINVMEDDETEISFAEWEDNMPIDGGDELDQLVEIFGEESLIVEALNLAAEEVVYGGA